MAHPDRPPIPPPPPAMTAADARALRGDLHTALASVAAIARDGYAGDESEPGRRGYSGATVDAELAFALYREACARGLHHTSIEAQAIADVDRFRHADDFVSLDEAAVRERVRIAREIARPHRWIRALVAGANVRAQIATGARDGDRSFVAELDGTRQPVELWLEDFTSSWWPEFPIRETPPRRRAKPATTKPAPKRRGKVR